MEKEIIMKYVPDVLVPKEVGASIFVMMNKIQLNRMNLLTKEYENTLNAYNKYKNSIPNNRLKMMGKPMRRRV